MLNFIRAILHPEAYHGNQARPPFFEGWYFKLVDASGQNRYAVIPGVFKGHDPEHRHAFVQVLDGVAGRASYHRYAYEDFHAAEYRLDLRVGPNRFTANGLSLDIRAPELTLKGSVHFSGVTPWPVTLLSPGIMGWYAWTPFMECYHGVVSLDHALAGTLQVNGEEVGFDGGRGYAEKDWGQAFPAAWVWMQTNNFEQPGTSLTASVATIPWLRGTFPGFIVGLWHDGTLHRFATYARGRIEELSISDYEVAWTLINRTHRLEILARRAEGSLIHAPTREEMGRRITETLNAVVRVRLSELKSGRVEFEETGRHAGLEAVGELARLKEMWERKTLIH